MSSFDINNSKKKKRVRPGDPCSVLLGERYWIDGTIKDVSWRSDREIDAVLIQFAISSSVGYWYSFRPRVFVRWYAFNSDAWKRDPQRDERVRLAKKQREQLANEKLLAEREAQECPTSAKTLAAIEASTRRELEQLVGQGLSRLDSGAPRRATSEHQPPWYRVLVQEWLRDRSKLGADNDDEWFTFEATKARKKNKRRAKNAQRPKPNAAAELLLFNTIGALPRCVLGADDASICSDALSDWSEVFGGAEGADDWATGVDDWETDRAMATHNKKPERQRHATTKPISEAELVNELQGWEQLVASLPELESRNSGNGRRGDERDDGHDDNGRTFDERHDGQRELDREDRELREAARLERERAHELQEREHQEREALRIALAVQLAQFSVQGSSGGPQWDSFDLSAFQPARPPTFDTNDTSWIDAPAPQTLHHDLDLSGGAFPSLGKAAGFVIQEPELSSNQTTLRHQRKHHHQQQQQQQQHQYSDSMEDFIAVRAAQVLGDFMPVYFPDSTSSLTSSFELPSSSASSCSLLRPADAHPAVALGIDPLYRPARECVEYQPNHRASNSRELQSLLQLKEAGLIMEEEFALRSRELSAL